MALNNGSAYLPTAGEGGVTQWFGTFAGTVIDNHDPLGVGRLRLNVPQVLGSAVSAWAVPAGTYYQIPTNGTPVSVAFLGGDPAQPVWNGPLDLNPLVQSAAGVVVTYSPSQPANPKVGDVWYETFTNAQGQIAIAEPQIWTFNTGTSTYSWVAQGGLDSTAIANINGSQIIPGSLPTTALGFSAHDIGGNGATVGPVAPGSGNSGDLWFDSTNGYLLNQYTAYNSNFDNGIGGWTAQEGTATLSTAWAYNGTESLLITANGVPGTNNTALAPLEPVSPGSQVVMTAYVMANSALPNASCFFNWFDASQTYVSTAPTAVQALTAGSMYVLTLGPVTVPDGVAYLGAGVGDLQNDAAGINFAIDNIQIGIWTPYQLGTNAIAAGSITSNMIAANAIVAGMIAAGAIDSFTINSPQINGGTINAADILVSGTGGGLFVYGSGGTTTATYSTAGTFTWTAPSGVTSVKAEVWGGGGAGATGSNTTGGGGGGGGGEYATEATVAVTAGNGYTVTVGGAGANSSFVGNTTTVLGHGGAAATSRTGAAGGSGSTNTTHYNGGNGANGSSGTSTVSTFTSSGTWTAPTGVTSVTVECWGPGSGGVGGGTAGGANSGGYGGSGGAYARSTLAVTPGTGYPYSIGTGGAGGAANNLGSAGSGPTTWNGGQVSADYARSYSVPGRGSASIGSTVYGGGTGGTATSSGGGGGAGSAGSSGNGGNGANSTTGTGAAGGSTSGTGGIGGSGGSTNTSGSNGNTPGAGGGGGGGGSSAGHGGNGARGQIRITYVLPSNAGGGGAGSSGGTASAGHNGTAGSSGTGGAGGAAVSGGGAGGAGGNDNVTGVAGSTPGGGGGGGGAAVAGGAGTAGQVKLTYTPPATLIASIAGAPTTDPVAAASVPAGYMGSVTAAEPGVSPATKEIWHSVTPPTNTSGTVRYKLMPDNTVMVQIQLTVSATAAAGTLTLISGLAAAYTPATMSRGPVGYFINGTPTLAQLQGLADMRWSANTNGTFTVQAFAGGASGSGVTELDFTIRYALD